MQRPEANAPMVSNTMVFALAGLIVLLGAGFLFAYDTLRSNRVDFASAARAAETPDGERTRPRYAGENDYDALIELGIDPDDESLSPQARAAIARAHRAAQEAGAAAPVDTPDASDVDAGVDIDADADIVGDLPVVEEGL